jgi:hypothetical protein
MVNRQRIALAVLSAFSLLPLTAHAGAGIGVPTAPSAGTPSTYCCATVRTVEIRDNAGKVVFSFVNGDGCQVFDPADFTAANSCPGTVVKCRGELFSPNNAERPGKVDRCLTP